MNAIQKALSVATGGNLNDWLPAPLANEVIAYIREINIMRRLIASFVMTDRVMTRPKKTSALAAYHIPDGTTATTSEFTTTTLTFEAKKLMGYTLIDEEAIEDTRTLPNIIDMVLKDFAEAIAYAEEYTILQGDEDHLATAPTPSSATAANWYVHDPRIMFDGIFEAADGTDAATAVDAGGGAFDLELVNQAIYNLGKFGRVKRDLVCIVPSEQAANIRANDDFHDASKSGLSLASYITWLGSAGEGDGIVTVVYGVPVYEAPNAPAGEAVLYKKDCPLFGDRRRIKFKSEEVIESDQRKYVVSERVDLKFQYDDALCLIEDLSTNIVS